MGERHSSDAERGAYVLAIELGHGLAIDIGGRPPTSLDPGVYLYAGSARGPGGIRARLTRHLRRDKRRHWHVDQLTAAAAGLAAVAVPGGDECALMDRLLALPGAHAPVAGFGSTDCRRCRAHLVVLPDARTPAEALARLVAGRPGVRDFPWVRMPPTSRDGE